MRAMNSSADPSPTVDLGMIYRAIGALESQGRELLRRANEHDAETKVLNRNVICLTHSVADLEKEVTTTVMPVVRDVQNWKQRAIALSLVGGMFGTWLLAQVKGWFG